MKNKALALILSSLLAISFTSCSDSKSESAPTEQKPTETTAETAAEQTTETETEPTTEKATAPPIEYYDGLTYPDTMTDKEKENTSYREFTLLYPEKAFQIGVNRLSYGIPQETGDAVHKKVKSIEENIRELKIYDEQLDDGFLSHIILPPNYDENKEYPVFLVCDAEYWLTKLPDAWQLINEGEAAPVIFVTLGYDYDTDGADDNVRYDKFAVKQDKMLDFITNDLMQLISANYKVDSSRSVLFGHSLGGLFSHYALCNSDKYEYQPFANYIIASPALWSYYYDSGDKMDLKSISDPYAYRNEFGYFDRNETMNKKVFICAGENETYRFRNQKPEEYADLPTIPEDAKSVYERLSAHGVDADLMIYENSYHRSYVGSMFCEYLKQNFPPNN